MPERMPEDMPDTYLPGRMPGGRGGEDNFDEISSELSSPPLPCQKVLPEKMLKNMPDRMQDRMSEYMSDRMFWWGSLEVSNLLGEGWLSKIWALASLSYPIVEEMVGILFNFGAAGAGLVSR
jgi:hypothetical protein